MANSSRIPEFMDLSDLLSCNYETRLKLFTKLIHAVNKLDPTVCLLVLEGVYCIGISRWDFLEKNLIILKNIRYNCDDDYSVPGGADVSRWDLIDTYVHLLRKWRYESPLCHCPVVLKCLKIFKGLKIPLLVDNEHLKLSLSDYEGHVEEIDIGLESRISFFGSDDEKDFPYKNIMRGHWYTIVDSSSNAPDSGEEGMKTLHELGVRGLWQGEIIYNPTKNIVIVVLYAARNEVKEKSFTGLKKPTLDVVRQKFGENTQITLSIVVPKSKTASSSNRSNPWMVNHLIHTTFDEINNGGAELISLNDMGRINETENLDLSQVFVSPEGCMAFMKRFTEKLQLVEDPAIALLALEGLYRLGKDVSSKIKVHPLPHTNEDPQIEELRRFLKVWQFTSHTKYAYKKDFGVCTLMLRSLTIFKIFQVPLFIDNYGQFKFLRFFGAEELEDINVNEETIVAHVTHQQEANKICNLQKFQPSDRKNSIAGTWFGVWENSPSVYGSKGFKTTLKQLGIKGLEQGEIVFYKNERNVILYATDDAKATFHGLKKIKLPVTERIEGNYVKVSIFIPSRLLPTQDEFWNVISQPFSVVHGNFCLVEKRSKLSSSPFKCLELSANCY